jgi:predicted kinase
MGMRMEDYGRALDSQTLAKPLLIFKIGVLGCAPLDFPELLAEQYNAEFLSSDLVRKAIIDEREAQGDNSRSVKINKIRGILRSRAEPILTDGEDVVLDMFVNGIKTRQFPVGLAQSTGALTLALWINTPFQTAIQRVEQWAEDDAFPIPVAKWDIHPVDAAKTMMSGVAWPQHEGIDFVFNLDGTTDTEGLLMQFDDKLEHFGLADRYESVD